MVDSIDPFIPDDSRGALVNYPDDLNKDNIFKTGQDFFTIPVVNLKVSEPYSFNFQWVFPDGKVSPWSDTLTLTTAGYVSKLTKPTVTVTPSSLGYIVSYTTQTDKNFDFAVIEEVVSTSNTAPTTGYQQVLATSANPAEVTVGNILKRWVRVKLIDKISGNSPYSDPVAVTPIDPVAAALDITPPASATSIVAVWSGNNIIITATVAADAKKFIIRLTNGSTTGFFTKFPTTSGTSQTITLTESELYNVLGAYFTSFSGLFISADALDNRDSGAAFTVPEKTNSLAGVTPTFTLTPISNGYSVTYTLPSGASHAKVYASTSAGFTPNDNTNLVYSGSSPGIVIDTVYTLKYVKIKFFNSDGTTSNFSAEQSVTPGNIGALSLISNPVKIATDGSIFTGDLDAQGQAIQSGARIFFNRVGLFVYDSTTAGPTTQIVGDASTSSPTFITTSAKIADWMITSNKIENTLHAGTSSYAGLSPSGTYAFWAGSTVSGGNAQANFSVTPAGAVIAKNITITGGSLTVGASSIAASTGKLISTDAEITGKITANSGTINGNLDITGTFYIGSSPSSGDRILINSGGIAAYANGIESPRFQLAKDGTGKIGGWTINSTTLSSIGGAITLNPADGIVGPAVSGGYAFKLDSDGDFSFAGGKISYNHSTSILIIQNTKLQLNIENNEDGTSGDKTVVVDEETGFLTTGRAFFFGGGSDPRTAGPGGSQIQSRAQYNNGSQGDSDFDAGDIWMQRE